MAHSMLHPRIVVTAGEPAGIGPDLCIAMAAREWPCELVVAADRALLEARAAQLHAGIELRAWTPEAPPGRHRPGTLAVWHHPLAAQARAGVLDPRNARYVLDLLDAAVAGCVRGRFDAMVTAPVQKSVVCDAGIEFSGHTEYLATLTGAPRPVMMLVAGGLRVALATTHLPLRRVSDAITRESLDEVIRILERDLRTRFGLSRPRIVVCGLNPHAGESGHLGHEEIDTIIPVMETLRAGGMHLIGPAPADTAFTPHMLAQADAVLAMYHDQGLPVLKHAGFGHAVNVTLGLPIVRTSVDHGTAYDIAGRGLAQLRGLEAAVQLARKLCDARVSSRSTGRATR